MSQNARSGNPATGVRVENVDTTQQPNTPNSQTIGLPLALGELIGTTPVGRQQDAPGLPDNQQKAPFNPTQFTVPGVANEYYETYQGTRSDKYQYHSLPVATFKPPAGTYAGVDFVI